RELRLHEQVDLPIETIKEILIKLARGDLVEYKSFGNWFGKINDPILNEFLKVWGEIEVAKQNPRRIKDRTIQNFETAKKRFNEYKGYLAEVFMIQILWNGQRKTLPGRCFHAQEDITLPWGFSYIDQRRRPGTGQKMEVDIYAAAGTEAWMAESKWWSDRKVGRGVVENLLAQADIVKEREGKYLKTLRLWLFAYDGVTGEAEELMRQNGVLWSTRAELDELLKLVNLRKLPEIEEGEPS
ncbi:MAG: hypothetical protein GY859_30720, partial [Desulfobacterales bacterium]|nr:hypothetical protein [Desulfobacterales bacterium]